MQNAISERVYICIPIRERDKVALRGEGERDKNMHNILGQEKGQNGRNVGGKRVGRLGTRYEV